MTLLNASCDLHAYMHMMCTRARARAHTHTHTHTAGGRWPEGAESKGARGAQEAVAFTLAPQLAQRVDIVSLSFGLVAVCHRFYCLWSTICSDAKSMFDHTWLLY